MKTSIFHWGCSLVAMSLVLLSGCRSTYDPNATMEPTITEEVQHEFGVPSSVESRTVEYEAVVHFIDYKYRTVTLKDAKGVTESITVGPEVKNFRNVEKGDQVRVMFQEETIINVKTPDGKATPLPKEMAATGTSMVAGEGDKPASMSVHVKDLVAVVTSVDLDKHTATLLFADGVEKEYPVWEEIELRQDHVGTEVMIHITKAMAVKVEKI